MQKKIIALAVAGLASSGAFAQSNVEIYGNIDMSVVSYTGSYSGQVGNTVNSNGGAANGLFNGVGKNGHSFNGSTGNTAARIAAGTANVPFIEYGSRAELASGLKTASRIGFRGTEDLGGGLKAGFVIESDLANDGNTAAGSTTSPTANIIGNRETTVSLTHASYGRVKAGRQSHAALDLLGIADPFLGKGPGGIEQMLLSPLTSTTTSNALRFDTKVMGVALTYEHSASENSDRLNNAAQGSVTDLTAVYADGPLVVGVGHLVARDYANTFNGTLVTLLNTGNTNLGTGALATLNSTGVTNLTNAGAGVGVNVLGSYSSSQAVADAVTRGLSLVYNQIGGSYDFGVAKLGMQYVTVQSSKNAISTNTAANNALNGILGMYNLGSEAPMINASTYQIGLTIPMGAHSIMGSFVSTNDKRTMNQDGRSLAIGYEYALSKRTTLTARGAKVNNTNGSTYGVIAGGTQAIANGWASGNPLNDAVTNNNRIGAVQAGIIHRF